MQRVGSVRGTRCTASDRLQDHRWPWVGPRATFRRRAGDGDCLECSLPGNRFRRFLVGWRACLGPHGARWGLAVVEQRRAARVGVTVTWHLCSAWLGAGSAASRGRWGFVLGTFAERPLALRRGPAPRPLPWPSALCPGPRDRGGGRECALRKVRSRTQIISEHVLCVACSALSARRDEAAGPLLPGLRRPGRPESCSTRCAPSCRRSSSAWPACASGVGGWW